MPYAMNIHDLSLALLEAAFRTPHQRRRACGHSGILGYKCTREADQASTET